MRQGHLAVGAVSMIMAISGIAADARAQTKTDAVTADYLFREGRKAALQGDYKKARPLFSDSLKLDASAGTLLNLADCEEHLDLVASAYEHWREAIDALRGKSDKRLELATRRLSALESKLPHLTIKLASGAPSDVHVERDGVDLPAAGLGLPLPVDPGSHRIVVRAMGFADREYAVATAEAENVELAVALGDKKALPGALSSTPPPHTSPLRTAGVAVIALGGVGLALGGILGIVAIDKRNAMRGACGVEGCSPAGVDAAAAGKTAATVSTVAVIGGAAALAGGIVLFLTHPSIGTSTPTTTVGTSGVPGGAGLFVARTF